MLKQVYRDSTSHRVRVATYHRVLSLGNCCRNRVQHHTGTCITVLVAKTLEVSLGVVVQFLPRKCCDELIPLLLAPASAQIFLRSDKGERGVEGAIVANASVVG